MKTKPERSRASIILKSLIVTGALAFAFSIASPVAEAHGKRGKRHHHRHHHNHRVVRHGPVYHPHVRPHRHHRFSAPHRIHRRHYVRYDSYYWGRTYHAGHGHYHRVYRFPVYTRHGVVYRPHAYCDGRFIATGRFTVSGPVFRIDIGF